MSPATYIKRADTPPEIPAPAVTEDQLALIRRTVAADATADELKLYLYDCARQGVHPLDKLIHFTKRAGKYTPITSIDFMRTRAADTGEYAGSDDAAFTLQPSEPSFAATVTVWRMVQGQKCSFTATARWTEYKPDGQDFMWRKMPHTMLAKCAEACALRKGFPRQLAGLYAREEMDMAGPAQGYSVEAPTAEAPAADVRRTPTSDSATTEHRQPAPAGYHWIHGYQKNGEWHEFYLLAYRQDGGGFKFSTKRDAIGDLVRSAWQDGVPIQVTDYTQKKNSLTEGYVNKLTVYKPPPTDAELDAELAVQDMARRAGQVL